MPRSILSIVLALILFVGFATTAKADVTGSFDIHISLEPTGTQTEAVEFEFDLQSNLQLTITLSGLSFGFDIGFGVTGVEFAILSLNTNLGALSVNDTFVFAAPFACSDFAGVGNGPNSTADCTPSEIQPIGDSVGNAVGKPTNNAIGFVKKRIELELNIAGITLTNLALFEDVDFPDITPGTTTETAATRTHEHDHFGIDQHYYVNEVNSKVDDQTPTYGFGDVITISGQTVSGITVTGSTGICASGKNFIKKRSWTYEVNKACTASLGGALGENDIEDGAKTPMLFEFETLSVEGIEVGGVTIDVDTTFKPLEPVFSDITVSFSVLDLADVVVTMSSDNITSLTLSKIVYSVSTGNLSLTLTDTKGDLSIDTTVAVLSVVLNPNQNPADLTVTLTTTAGTGITKAAFSLGISRGALSLDSTTTFSGKGTLAWASTSFVASLDTGDGFSFGASLSYTPTGMKPGSIDVGFVF